MSGLESDTIGGFNHFLKTQQAQEGEAVLSTILFDHEVKVLYDRCPVKAVQPLTGREYVPRGTTALLDALGGTLRHIWRNQGQLRKAYQPEKTIVMIITDGYENSSCRYSLPSGRAKPPPFPHCGRTRCWRPCSVAAAVRQRPLCGAAGWR